MGLFDLFKKKGGKKSTHFEQHNQTTPINENSEQVNKTNSKSMHQPEYLDDAEYFVKGYISENEIHLGSYFRNSGDREEIFLVFENNEYFLEKEHNR